VHKWKITQTAGFCEQATLMFQLITSF